jgi:hypothetical protein
MTKDAMAKLMDHIFEECRGTRSQGQKEYAHRDEEAFSNFNEAGHELGVDRKMAWFIYFFKHYKGVTAYIKGHKSQREDVRGRIKDMIVYLCLLWGMIDEEQEGRAPNVPGGNA